LSERCPGCGNEIDPDVCGCGEFREGHNAWWAGHEFVPMGCDCLRDKVHPAEKHSAVRALAKLWEDQGVKFE